MTESSQNIIPNALRKPRAKPPLAVELVGPVGELVAAEFERMRLQMDRLEQQLEQLAEQVRYPIKIYTEEDFTALFKVERRTQQNYRKAGKLHCLKLGEKVFYTRQHIEEFMVRCDTRNSKSAK